MSSIIQEFPSQDEVQQLGYKQTRREAEMRRFKLRRLKHKIRVVREHGYPVFENYPARWNPEAFDRATKTHGRLVDLNAFGRQIREQLWEAIKAQFELPPDQPPTPTLEDEAARLASEADDQERFRESRLRVYVGRRTLRNQLAEYADGNQTVPCLLTGESGSGKSAALARFLRVYRRARSDTTVIAHFIGASPRSASLVDSLRRLCLGLKDALGYFNEVPEEIAHLITTFRSSLFRVPSGRRVLIVLDALNQLEETERARELHWLPHDLPPHVKVVASCLVDPKSPEAEQDAVARALGGRQYHPLRMGELTQKERGAILRQVPSISSKTLDENQVTRFLQNPATENPLYLRLALEELRGFGVYEKVTNCIDALPRDGLPDVTY